MFPKVVEDFERYPRAWYCVVKRHGYTLFEKEKEEG
jgi:hypothetical protein